MEPTYAPRIDVVTIETPGLGDRSYVVHDGATAVVIDPQRDIDRLLDEVGSRGLRVSHVLETHLHNDYVTGGLALAEETGAEYGVPGADEVRFARRPIADGDAISTGRLAVVARHTPGHTPNHLSYVVHAGSEPVAVFTGGSMLFGAVGRTDLIAPERTEELTRAQYRSVRRLADELPGHVSVHPTHGFGSFCAATETSGESSTIADERSRNVALVTEDEDAFVARLMEGLGDYPRYYVHMARLNAGGPAAADLSAPARVDGGVLRRRIEAGEWVVDLRQRRAFARHHLRGAVSIELGDPFATYFGWVLPWGAPVTLVGDTAEEVAEARRQLSRIGVDDLAGAAVGSAEALAEGRAASYAVASFEDLASSFPGSGKVVLDVRGAAEWADGHLDGAVHIPFFELGERVGELPDGELWVHCASGLRASIAASLLERGGRGVVLVDDDWQRAGELGLPIRQGR